MHGFMVMFTFANAKQTENSNYIKKKKQTTRDSTDLKSEYLSLSFVFLIASFPSWSSSVLLWHSGEFSSVQFVADSHFYGLVNLLVLFLLWR